MNVGFRPGRSNALAMKFEPMDLFWALPRVSFARLKTHSRAIYHGAFCIIVKRKGGGIAYMRWGHQTAQMGKTNQPLQPTPIPGM